jgi:hypothetical protein
VNYSEFSAADFGAAQAQAASAFANGRAFAAVQVGSDVVVFAHGTSTGGLALDATDTAVVLVGKSLTDIDFTNIG